MLWTGWWLFFGVASEIGEREGFTNLIVHLMMPGGIALITTWIAFRWQTTGGFMLLAEGMLLSCVLALGALNPADAATAAFLVVTLIVPPIISGLLFLGGIPEGHRPQHV